MAILKDAVQNAAFEVFSAEAAPNHVYADLPADVQLIILRQFVMNQLGADDVTRNQFLTALKGAL